VVALEMVDHGQLLPLLDLVIAAEFSDSIADIAI